VRSIFRFPLELGEAQLSSGLSIKFATTGTITVKEAGDLKTEDVRDLEIQIRLVPSAKESQDTHKKEDWLEIEMPGAPEKYYPFAQQFAIEAAEKLAFFYPKLRIGGGYSEAERIPESEEERTQIGDKRFLVQMSLREVDGPFPIDREHLSLLSFMAGLERVLRQYVSARDAKNSIDGYLGMFKVLETLFYRGKGHTAEVLKKNQELREILRCSYRMRRSDDESWAEPDDESIDAMVSDMVQIRDRCAHLRGHNAFGYAPGDTAVFREVDPALGILSGAAREAIRRRVNSQSGGRLPTMYGLAPPSGESTA
jgi:hypothetical protein